VERPQEALRLGEDLRRDSRQGHTESYFSRAALVALCASGALRPLIDRVVPLDEARSAFAALAAGEQRGKLVVRVTR
jgi:NADPH:quinone reductase-like Zn-dependent oxidoreductase